MDDGHNNGTITMMAKESRKKLYYFRCDDKNNKHAVQQWAWVQCGRVLYQCVQPRGKRQNKKIMIKVDCYCINNQPSELINEQKENRAKRNEK